MSTKYYHGLSPQDHWKTPDFPLARIKKVMRMDDEVKVCAKFVLETKSEKLVYHDHLPSHMVFLKTCPYLPLSPSHISQSSGFHSEVHIVFVAHCKW